MKRIPLKQAGTPPARRGTRTAPTNAPRARDIGNQDTQRLLQAVQHGQVRVGRHDDAAERDSGGTDKRAAASATSSALAQTHGAGRPLDPVTQGRAQQSLGDRFADVRVHDDAAAAHSAAAIGAAAFTDGRHIAFAAGQYQPDRPDGWKLLEHELGHVARADAAPNLLRRQQLASQIPPQVAPATAGVSFDLPGGKLLTGDWNDLSTVNPTTVTLSVSATGIDLSFDPALLIDAQWPVSDMEWSGLRYDFAGASVSSINLVSTQDVAVTAYQSEARGKITGFFTGLLSGTRMATPGYDPLTDPNISETLAQIRTNFQSQPSSGGDVTAADVTRIRLFGEATISGPIQAGAGDGSISVNGPVRVQAELEGTGADLGQTMEQGLSPHIRRLTLDGAFIVRSGGEDVAQLHEISVAYGGAVTVERMTLLGRAAEAAHTEEGLRGLALILVLASGEPSDRLRLSGAQPDLSAQIVPGLTRGTIQDALTQAVVEFIRQNRGLLPGLDLTSIFGITPPMGDFPPPRPPAGPGSAFG